jgi:glycosyltransferase involved in cell wall biosynthesis
MIDISFITSCYNAELFLDELIENISQQSNQNYEHIIVDSQSTDNSREIALKWQAADRRVKLIEQSERTPYGVSWLLGWQAARGSIVCNSNADDRSYPWRTTQILYTRNKDILESSADYRFYYGGYETRVDGRPIAKGIPPPYSEEDLSQLFRCGIHVHWDNSLRYLADWRRMFRAGAEYQSAFDYWLVLYFISLQVRGVSIPNCFSVYNQRSDSVEQSNKELSVFESLRAIKEFYPDGNAMRGLEDETRIQNPQFYKKFQEFLSHYE